MTLPPISSGALVAACSADSKRSLLRGQFPDIARIAEIDSRPVGRVVFGPENGKSEIDTAFAQNSAWSGTLLFCLQGSNQNGRLMSTGTAPFQIDTLNEVRDVFYRRTHAANDQHMREAA
jgi:hypothetical protein